MLATEALGAMGNMVASQHPAIIEALLAALNQPFDANLRLRAAYALGTMQLPTSYPGLLDALTGATRVCFPVVESDWEFPPFPMD